MGVEVSVETRKLSKLIRDLAPQQITALLMRAGFMAEAGARIAAPVDTGILRNSLRTEKTGPKEVSVGSNVEYAPFVEMGTRFMQARAYLEPAIKAAVEWLMRELLKVFRRAQ